MRSFFSPFTDLKSDDFDESEPYTVSLTVYEQNKHKVFLITLSNKDMLSKAIITQYEYASFSSAFRKNRQCLVIEAKTKISEAKVVNQKSCTIIRAKNCSFLPLGVHKKRDIIGYLTNIGNDEQIIVVPLPEDYRVNAFNKDKYPVSIQNDPQPDIKDWSY